MVSRNNLQHGSLDNMRLHTYETPIKPIEESDLIEINQWYARRGLLAPTREFLPPAGLVWPGVAAGYMIKTDANIVFLEHYITNPDADQSLKNVALDLISNQFISTAFSQGVLAVYAISANAKIGHVAQSFNFIKIPAHDMWVLRR